MSKTGLDYFSLDVGFLRDKKVRLLRTEFGASSVVFVLYVLSRVYEEDGYFLKWDKDEALMAANEILEPPQYIGEVLQGCLSRSLFDERVFQVFGVLTSAGIQRRYLRGCAKRDVITIFNEYWLLNIENRKDVPAGIRAKLAFFSLPGGKTSEISGKNGQISGNHAESKVKKRKEKKEDERRKSAEVEEETGVSETISVVFTAYYEKVGEHMTERAKAELLNFAQTMGTACCIRAMDTAISAGKPNWAYIRGILNRKREQGVRSISDWDRVEAQRREALKGNPANGCQEPYRYDPGSREGSL